MDVGGGMTFCFLRVVWGCAVFFAFVFGVCGGCCCGPEAFFLGDVGVDVGRRRVFNGFGFVGADLNRFP
jgi:hypothetical protein